MGKSILGLLDISSVKLGTADVKLYLGTEKIYPVAEEPAYVICKYGGLYSYSKDSVLIYNHCSGDTASTCADYGSSQEFGINNFSDMMIDDSDWIPAQSEIQPQPFREVYTVVYKLIDKTLLPAGVFKNLSHHFVDAELLSVELPDTITTIGYGALENCDCMTSGITITSVNPPTVMYDANNEWRAFDNTSDTPIYVQSECVDAYKNAPFWSNYANRIQAIP